MGTFRLSGDLPAQPQPVLVAKCGSRTRRNFVLVVAALEYKDVDKPPCGLRIVG